MLVSWFLKEASVTGTRRLCHLHSYCVSLHLWFSVPPYIWLVFLLKDIRQKETTSAKEDVFYLEICQCNQFVKWVHPDYRVLDKIKPLFYRPQICLSEGLQRIQLQARGINPGCYVLSCTLSLFYSNSWTATTEKTLWFLIFCPLHFLCMQFSVNSLLDSIEQAHLSPLKWVTVTTVMTGSQHIFLKNNNFLKCRGRRVAEIPSTSLTDHPSMKKPWLPCSTAPSKACLQISLTDCK